MLTNLDISLFVSTVSLYVQTMVLTIWLLVKINELVVQGVRWSLTTDQADFAAINV